MEAILDDGLIRRLGLLAPRAAITLEVESGHEEEDENVDGRGGSTSVACVHVSKDKQARQGKHLSPQLGRAAEV